MQLNFDNWLNYFTMFIIFIKIIFITCAVGYVILSHSTSNKAASLDPKLLYWKERTEFIFTICMAILLIYHFNPRLQKKPISQETGILFFLFGWILIITANWSLFITESPFYKKIMNVLH